MLVIAPGPPYVCTPNQDAAQAPLRIRVSRLSETADTDQTPLKRRIGHRVVDAVARAVIGFALALPYKQRVRFTGWTVSRLIGRIAPYHKRATAHLRFIYPDKSEAECKRIAAACLDNVGRTLIENYSSKDFLAHMKGTPVEGPGLAAVQEAHAAGRAVILQTGHFGNYEAVRATIYALGIEPGGIYREMSNPHFHEHYVQTLLAYGGPAFPRGARGMRGVMKHLKSGGQLIILNDQHEFGAPVLDFMGQPARTTLSPAELALRFDALVVPFFGIRNPDGLTFQCVMEDPIPHSDANAMTQEMNDRLSARIRSHPDQWFWVPRRWRADENQ